MSTVQEDKEHLKERLSFLGLDAAATSLLRDIQPLIKEKIGDALSVFYSKVRGNANTAAFFKDDSHVNAAKNLQSKHWELITSGTLDENYVAAVTRIGKTHARIGLEPRWYIAGYALVLEQLIHSTLSAHWPSRFGRSKSGKLANEVSVIVKAALLDMDYAISVYLAELERFAF